MTLCTWESCTLVCVPSEVLCWTSLLYLCTRAMFCCNKLLNCFQWQSVYICIMLYNGPSRLAITSYWTVSIVSNTILSLINCGYTCSMIVYNIYNGQAPRSIAAATQSRSGPNNAFRLLLRTTFTTVKSCYYFCLTRNELDFVHTGRLNNSWNENQPIRVGRDGQVLYSV